MHVIGVSDRNASSCTYSRPYTIGSPRYGRHKLLTYWQALSKEARVSSSMCTLASIISHKVGIETQNTTQLGLAIYVLSLWHSFLFSSHIIFLDGISSSCMFPTIDCPVYTTAYHSIMSLHIHKFIDLRSLPIILYRPSHGVSLPFITTLFILSRITQKTNSE